jgi:hypothetical protein
MHEHEVKMQDKIKYLIQQAKFSLTRQGVS